MNATQPAKWSVDFNFPIPSRYRRKFILHDQDCLLTLSVAGKTVSFNSEGGCGAAALSRQLDWIEECMNTVRKEFGQ